MSTEILKRLRSMDGAELKFRAAAAIRSRVGRARTAITPPAWHRESLTLSDLPALSGARRALAGRDWRAAHHALAQHFASREPHFAVDPRRLPELAREITRCFPHNDAAIRGDRVLTGTYDLLGYQGVVAGSPPDWHLDPVHRRRAPLRFWDAVPYLDPACGDHKITWELNRHQHFLQLARAFVITGDPRYYRAFVVHLEDWIRHNPPLQGTNWASMLELAFRSVSWIWALHVFAPAVTGDDVEPWVVDLLLALERQLDHIERNLSRYFSPNTHLSGEALALYVCGRGLPELAASPRFERVGRITLVDEARRQILPDGGHAERSPHYHRYSTDFYLLALSVARITNDPAAPLFADAARRQAVFLRAIADDGGRMPLIGDDDGGQLFPICGREPSDASDTLATAAILLDAAELAVGPPPEETWWMCGTTHSVPATIDPRPQHSAAFEETGYYVCRDRDANHLVFDCGPHGFLNGGHAHADALAVVASVGGTPLLIDPGTATYTMDGELRDRFRSTAMHNTVVVQGRSQSQPRGPFHWSTRTDARCRAWQPGQAVDYVEGHHDAYAPVRHTRCVFSLHGIGWIVVDHLAGPAAPAQAAAMWHIHPGWSWARTSDRGVTFRTPEGQEAGLSMSVPLRVVRDGLDAFAPVYGRIVEALCLSGEFDAAAVATFVAASPEWTTARVTPVKVRHSLDRESRAAFRIDGSGATLVVLSSTADEGEDWGAGAYQTSARAVVLRLAPSGPVELCSVRSEVLASSMQKARRL
jgi:hypothetical protein